MRDTRELNLGALRSTEHGDVSKIKVEQQETKRSNVKMPTMGGEDGTSQLILYVSILFLSVPVLVCIDRHGTKTC